MSLIQSHSLAYGNFPPHAKEPNIGCRAKLAVKIWLALLKVMDQSMGPSISKCFQEALCQMDVEKQIQKDTWGIVIDIDTIEC